MAVKEKAAQLRQSFAQSGTRLVNDERFLRLAGLTAEFALSLMMALVEMLGGCGPLGVAMVARAGGGAAGFLSLAGACVGYLISGGVGEGLKFIAAAVLTYTVAFILRDTQVIRRAFFMPLVAAAVMLLTGFLGRVRTASNSMPAGVLLFLLAVIAGAGTYFFARALTEEELSTEASETRQGVSRVLLLSCALMALTRLCLFGLVSVGRTAAVCLVLVSAYRGGALSGAGAGAALGLAMDIAFGGTPFFTMAYAFSGLVSGLLCRHGRLMFVLCYVLANAVAVLWTWGNGLRIEVLYEVFVASVVFLILPQSAINLAGGLMQPLPPGSGDAGLRRYSAQRVRGIAEACMQLYETVRSTVADETNDSDVAGVFDRAADSVCAGCASKQACWNRDCLDTLTIMNDATRPMLSRGRLEREDLAPRFFERCRKADAFIAAVNGELRGLLYRRQFRSRLQENRMAAWGQYADLAEILTGVSEELAAPDGPDPLTERRLIRWLRSMDIEADVSVFRDASGRMRVTIESGCLGQLTREEDYLDRLSTVIGLRMCCRPGDRQPEGRLLLLEAEPLAAAVGVASMRKKGERVSGDRGTYFKTDAGVLCILLSDGMGSGAEAAQESVAAIAILERFLKCGVAPSAAMRMLNSVMLLRNGDEWGFATVDLMCVDLFSGETCFYKFGAAPSYVKSARGVRRIRGESLAAGLTAGEDSAPDVVRMRLKPGSLAVIVSDGVVADGNDEWLRKLLAKQETPDMKALARSVLQYAAEEYGCEDDMTVLTVQVSERE